RGLVCRSPSREREEAPTDPRRRDAEAVARDSRDVRIRPGVRWNSLLSERGRSGGSCGNVGNRVFCDFRGFHSFDLTFNGVSHPPSAPSPPSPGEKGTRLMLLARRTFEYPPPLDSESSRET